MRGMIRDYHASYRQARKSPGLKLDVGLDPLTDHVLKTLLIYEIVDVLCSFDNLAFGLHLRKAGEDRLRNRLAQLVEEKVLFQDATGIYEFRQGDVRDFQALIADYKVDPNNQPEDLAEAVIDAHRLGHGQRWLEAKAHNETYYEDKRLRRRFIRPSDLNEKTFEALHQEVTEQEGWKDRYEGIALYVLCETMEEVETARRRVEENESERVLIGVPHEPIPIRESLLTLKAVQDLRDRPEMQDISISEQARLNGLYGNEEEGALGRFLHVRNRYFSGQDLIWFSGGGNVIVSQPDATHEPADRLMDELYDQRNRVKHGIDFNKVHVKRTGTSNTQLHDAVRELLDLGRDVKIDTSYGDNRGEMRYLKRCLADVGALRQQGVPHGTKRFYHVEHGSDKYRRELPALADMVDEIESLEAGETVRVQNLIADYAGPPYGQGPVALSLFLAFVIRRFGDTLSLKREPTAVGSVGACSPSLIYEMVDGDHPNAVFERRQITPEERTLIEGIYDLFSPVEEETERSTTVMISDAFAALKNWWDELSPLAQTAAIYDADEAQSTRQLIGLCRKLETETPHLFLTGHLQTPYGYAHDDAVTAKSRGAILAGLKTDKERIASRPEQFKKDLIETLMSVEPFEVEADVPVLSDYQGAIETWYKELDDNQRDQFAGWHSGDSKAILRHLGQISDLRETLLEDLPADPGFSLGKVDDWTADRSDDYVSKLEAGLSLITEHRVPVEAPAYEFTDGEIVKESGSKFQKTVNYRGPLTVAIEPDSDSACAYFTNTGDDPRRPDSQRVRVTDRFEHTINQGNTSLKLVSEAEAGLSQSGGKYGRVVTIELIDEDRKHVIEPTGGQLGLRETRSTFVLPGDRRSLEVTLRSLVENAVKFSDLTEEDVRAVLEDVLARL